MKAFIQSLILHMKDVYRLYVTEHFVYPGYVRKTNALLDKEFVNCKKKYKHFILML